MSHQPTDDVQQALAAWGLTGAPASPITTGHINRTLLVEDHQGQQLVLQRLNPIFGAEVNLDIQAITERLGAAGITTPRLVPTAAGELWYTAADGSVWRLMTFVAGHTVERADTAARCLSAGRFLGRFHRALWDCDHRFEHRRAGVHDTPRHLAALEQALLDHVSHPAFSRVEPVARRIQTAAGRLNFPDELPLRVVHGDPKITNIIFDETSGEAVCLVDLDTLARLPLALELGDALRSWCSPLGEEREGTLEMDCLRAALSGYAGAVGSLPEPAEREAIPAAVELIAVELAARFCADALNERYFGWDSARFASASAHNLARARSQIFLAESAGEHRSEMEELVKELWR